jgi:lysophospholipase L1-like esterase
MEGTNDITDNALKLNESEDAIEYMIDAARNRGVTAVFLATIPPIFPGGPNDAARPRVLQLNDEIRDLAVRKGAYLVDVYGALNADLSRYYAGNDLHPNAEGLRVIGEAFYSKIRATLDLTPPGLSSVMPLGLVEGSRQIGPRTLTEVTRF